MLAYKAILVALLVSASALQGPAQEKIDPARQAGQEMYSRMETSVRDTIDNKLRFAVASKRVDGNPLTSEDLENVLNAITMSGYQFVIDTVVCAEQSFHKAHNDASAHDACISERTANSLEFFQFAGQYADLLIAKGISKACEAKTRLLTFETRYPPYAFMKTRPLYAFDAKAYLECAKSRL